MKLSFLISRRRIFYLLVILAAVIFIFNLSQMKVFEKKSKKLARIIFNNEVEIRAEVLKTLPEKIKGLSGRKKILPDEGALFVYQEPGFYNFWMKGMNFAIDIIWLIPDDKQKGIFKVVDITPEISPASFPQTFSSKIPSQYILEVKAGFSKENDIKIGSKVKIQGL